MGTTDVADKLTKAGRRLGQGRLAEAVRLYEEVLRRDRGNRAANLGLRRAAWQADGHRAAVTRALGMLRDDPASPLALDILAASLTALGLCDEAIAVLGTALSHDEGRFARAAREFVDRAGARPGAGVEPGEREGGADDPAEAFGEIHRRRLWGEGSGPGSSPCRAGLYAAYVNHLIRTEGVRSIVDIGCGDWRLAARFCLENVDYLGMDVVREIVEANAAAHGGDNVRFVVADASTVEAVPMADLVLCKDVLQHLPNDRVRAILDKLSRHPLVLLVNDYGSENEECRTGDTRPLDPRLEPFGFPGEPVLAFKGKAGFLARR